MSGPRGGEDLRGLVAGLTEDQITDLVASLPEPAAVALLTELGDVGYAAPDSPAAFAPAVETGWRDRAHLTHLSGRIVAAVRDVEAGRSRRLIIQMPPRSGKTTMATLLTPAWIMARHPGWPIALTSHDGGLATSWGRQIRRWAEDGVLGPGVSLARDAGAAGAWETTSGGKMLSISIRESFTGRGAKVLVVDDPHKDFVDAHSPVMRKNVWDWWLSTAQTRLEPPYLVVVVMTRWHEDDLVGRLLSGDHEGDPADWEVITLPALAEVGDALGRAPGEPLLSPLLDEDAAAALARWGAVRAAVGTYTFSAMYQQRPAPAKGAVFDIGWWRFWTASAERAEADPRVVFLPDPGALPGARWVDSWDATFKGTAASDYVVGQRWVRSGPYRYLIAQQRGRWSFTATLARMQQWAQTDAGWVSPFGHLVHERLVEDKANGPAIIDVMRAEVSGLKAVNPTTSKEARARAVTPEIESGHVLLPHPGDPGNEWVVDLLTEVRNFPHDAHDDQVDALSQALTALREPGVGQVTVPGSRGVTVRRDLARTAGQVRRRG